MPQIWLLVCGEVHTGKAPVGSQDGSAHRWEGNERYDGHAGFNTTSCVGHVTRVISIFIYLLIYCSKVMFPCVCMCSGQEHGEQGSDVVK